MDFNKKLAFRGIRALYGNDGFEKLQQAHVTVIGVGGIGSWATEALCRTGIGSLTLIDNDTIEITNSNRQLHTTTKTCGQSKAQVLADRLLEINVCNYMYHHNTVFIEAGGAGGRIDPTKLNIGDIATANGDALISKLRNKLRKEYGFPSNGKKFNISCTFSNEKPIYSSKEDYISGDLPAFGASMSVTATAGLLISSWIISKITQR